jgi:peptide/nickel transport system substrate-binding protein
MHRILALVAALSLAVPALAQKTIRIAPQSNLAVLDPFWTTATVTRTHGYMIYDTLFGTDARNRVRPQMVDKWTVSADRRTWTFTLRDGLEFHDGAPVTSADVLASLARWEKRDALGQRLAEAILKSEALNARSFRIVLKQPFGLMLEALGKQGSYVPFVIPRRVAEAAGDNQLEDTTGSGPYVFKQDEWLPGSRVVYVKNPRYRPRAEPPSGTAGGKRVFVDRIEWHILRDAQTQVNALVKGEIDLVEQPAHEHYASLRASPDIQVIDNRHGAQVLLRFNHLQPPFNDARARRAALVALSQEPFLRAQYVSPDLYRSCASLYPCGTPYATEAGMQGLLHGDVQRARTMLREAGYEGAPVVILQPTDLATIAKLPLVAAQQLRLAGFKVELAALDWQAVVARRQKKDPPAQGGWSIFITTFNGLDLIDPVVNPAMNASCDRAWPGWPCDAKLEALRGEFLRAPGEAARKRVAAAAQLRALEVGTHAALGEYLQPVAARKNITGYLNAPVYLYWNLGRK